MKPSSLLSAQVEPEALYIMAREFVKFCGIDRALKRADFYATIAQATAGQPASTADKQVSDALIEAVEFERMRLREVA